MAKFDPTARPKFQAIVDFVKAQIADGTWKPGDRLPSQATWRDDYGVNYGTLRGAYLVLRAMDLIDGEQGNGVFVKGGNARTKKAS